VLDFSAPDCFRQSANLPLGPDGTWLAADLRLDRAGELSAALDLPRGTGMEALALAGLTRWGEDLPDRLDGDFALGAWNPQQGRLTCARDIMGVRPLCYTHRPGRLFAFASLPRGLHSSGIVARRLDPIALARGLVDNYAADQLTPFQEITWLPAGHSAVATSHGLRLHRAWRPDPANVGRWRGSANDAAATLRTLIHEAVTARLPLSGPVAAHLSGGLDSSAVTVIASRQLQARNRKLYAWSRLAHPSAGPLLDEREYVEAVLAQEADINWAPAYLPSFDEEGIVDPDIPLGGPLLDPDDRICAAAAATGSRILLSGAGGDEGATYNGVGIAAALLRQGHWRKLRAELRARAARQGKSFGRLAAGSVLMPLLPQWLLARRRRIQGQSLPDQRRRNALSFLRPPLAAQVTAASPPGAEWSSRPEDRVEMLTESYLAGRATRWSVIGARHGLAFSHPLADRRILDFALSLPLERFMDGGFTRQPYRNAMAGILPESIRWRDTKFNPYPDIPANLIAAAPGLLRRVETLRHRPAAIDITDLFDLDAIAAAFSAAWEPVSPEAAPLAPNRQIEIPRRLRMALHAAHSLILAEYVARVF
jgi:asparagine synthase (glutamine-hydrolysing)